MNAAMDKGVSKVIALLAQTLENGRKENSLMFQGDAQHAAQVFYSLWLGQICRQKFPAVPRRWKVHWRMLKY